MYCKTAYLAESFEVPPAYGQCCLFWKEKIVRKQVLGVRQKKGQRWKGRTSQAWTALRSVLKLSLQLDKCSSTCALTLAPNQFWLIHSSGAIFCRWAAVKVSPGRFEMCGDLQAACSDDPSTLPSVSSPWHNDSLVRKVGGSYLRKAWWKWRLCFLPGIVHRILNQRPANFHQINIPLSDSEMNVVPDPEPNLHKIRYFGLGVFYFESGKAIPGQSDFRSLTSLRGILPSEDLIFSIHSRL